MNQILPVLSDICIIFFDLLIFSKMVVFKKQTPHGKLLVCVGCAAIIAAYFTATYIFAFPPALSVVVFMTLPSLALFYCFSAYKDARFFLTFCFVDTVSMIIGFLGRYAALFAGPYGNLASLCVILVLFGAVYRLGAPYFQQYTRLLEAVSTGWSAMMASACIIYFAIVFLAAYPRPLLERLEYGPSYLVFCAVVLAHYAVLIRSIMKTQKIYEQYQQLQKEREFHRLAYTDALTGLGNRAAYMDQLNLLERTRGSEAICVLMFDMNHFKSINDTLGHQTGDVALQAAARVLQTVFPEPEHRVFRIGGDEFLAFAKGRTQAEIEQALAQLDQQLAASGAPLGVALTMAAGYAFVAEDETLENCAYRADQCMYQSKKGR